MISHHAAHDGTILLFNPGLIVLPVGTTAREGNFGCGAPVPYGLIHKCAVIVRVEAQHRSEEHTSELQSLMRISYAVFCLKKKNKPIIRNSNAPHTLTTKLNIHT